MAGLDFELRGDLVFFACPAGFSFFGLAKGEGGGAAGGVGGGSSLRSPTAYSKKLQGPSFLMVPSQSYNLFD